MQTNTMADLTLKAYAKINLGLDVIGRLENGYHLVKMVMQTVDLYDELSFTRTESGIRIFTDNGELPTDENNLIYKAAGLLFDTEGIDGGIDITLKKNIPIAAGMAGGSTDAAATLKAVNELFRLGKTTEELMELGVKIGADVPYCVMGGTALAEGIGEKLTKLPDTPFCHILIAKPKEGVSTKYVYEHLDAQESYTHPDIDGMVNAIKAGDLSGVISRLGNVLETVTIPALPIIDTIKQRMTECGASVSMMSGSGPTVFGIFTDKVAAEKAYEQFTKEAVADRILLTTLI